MALGVRFVCNAKVTDAKITKIMDYNRIETGITGTVPAGSDRTVDRVVCNESCRKPLAVT